MQRNRSSFALVSWPPRSFTSFTILFCVCRLPPFSFIRSYYMFSGRLPRPFFPSLRLAAVDTVQADATVTRNFTHFPPPHAIISQLNTSTLLEARSCSRRRRRSKLVKTFAFSVASPLPLTRRYLLASRRVFEWSVDTPAPTPTCEAEDAPTD
jgi:hypothetical protein